MAKTPNLNTIVRRPDRAEGGITPAEKKRMEEHSQLWIKRILRTEPIEPEKIIPAIKGVYAAAGLKEPRVVIVPSPLVMAVAGGFAAAIWQERKEKNLISQPDTDRATDNLIADAITQATAIATHNATAGVTDSATARAISDATRLATANATRSAIDNATRDATAEATAEATRSATADATAEVTDDETADAIADSTAIAIANATRNATAIATDEATASATASETASATADATASAISDATRNATASAIADATASATVLPPGWAVKLATEINPYLAPLMISCVKSWSRLYQGGNMWGWWDCYLTAARDILGLKLPTHEKYKYWEEAAIHGGFRVVHPEFCMVCDFPEVLKKDEQNRPHSDNGPSHLWRDGWAIWHWHGTRLKEGNISEGCKIIDAPDTLTLSEINAEKNAEIRRVMIDRSGRGSCQ